jgi:hypothetical protein
MKMKPVLLPMFGVMLFCLNAASYEFSTGKVFLRGVFGATVNVFRYDAIPSEASPGAGLMLGLEADYIVTRPWSLIAGFRPSFSPGYVDLGFSVGAKYRWDDVVAPITLYGSLELTPAVLLPVAPSSVHFNMGLRPSFGFEYFLMRDLVVGGQLAIDPSWLVTKRFSSFEGSIDIAGSIMYKI